YRGNLVLRSPLQCILTCLALPTKEPQKSFADREEMMRDVRSLREEHNFSTETAIKDVAAALRRHVDEKAFDHVLTQLPEGAIDFWRV
ncbi:MAG: DUF2267 domain-containing protein, partial [Synechococcales cyanobacterium K44_A2020_017]|nr:DUF2267 domain-containing protein [Synechococcales cyanobacterium K32_A2020_035]MBF2095152.1 DUF2267 domain-containing protein [Synechococcales cyanobacterium K44_A2020_017]